MNLYRFMKRLTVSSSVLAAASFCGFASDNTKTADKPDDTAPSLVLAENGKTDYQIVIPDKGKEEIVDNWLFAAAKLMQAAFEKNGFSIDVVEESAKVKDKPGIYLGATEFAKKSGIKVEQHDDWTYYHKAVGKDLIIAGNDKKDPVSTIKFTKTPLALLGTVKGVCDFLREYAGVRFLFMNMEQDQYPAGGWVAHDKGGTNKDGSLDRHIWSGGASRNGKVYMGVYSTGQFCEYDIRTGSCEVYAPMPRGRAGFTSRGFPNCPTAESSSASTAPNPRLSSTTPSRSVSSQSITWILNTTSVPFAFWTTDTSSTVLNTFSSCLIIEPGAWTAPFSTRSPSN